MREQSLWIVPVDQFGKTSYQQLAGLIRKAQSSNRPILQIVSVAGTTETGVIDPIDKVQEVLAGFSRQDGLDIWHHIDAAYGGFACSLLHQEKRLKLDAQIESSLKAMANANSITLDPHKFGYVPYFLRRISYERSAYLHSLVICSSLSREA
ncbi:MAG: pyridoxal-dependent decarboxylase [Bdellovibrionota bacterium]